MSTPHRTLLRNDVELLAVVFLWGFNFVAVKVGLNEIAPLAYNAVRFFCAALILLSPGAVRGLTDAHGAVIPSTGPLRATDVALHVLSRGDRFTP